MIKRGFRFALVSIVVLTMVLTTLTPPMPTAFAEDDETDYTQVPPLYITEVYVKGRQTGGGLVNSYSYFEVYNNSTSTIDMGDYTFYIATLNNKNNNTVAQTWPCPSLQLESGGTLVAWVNSDGALTVNDFNSFFGTDFVENEDIVRISYNVGLVPTGVRYLEIGTEPGPLDGYVSYAMFNEGDVPEVPATVNGAVKYTYPTNGGNGSLKLTTGVPTPGAVEEGQTPPVNQRVEHVPPAGENEPEDPKDGEGPEDPPAEVDFAAVPPLYITEVYAKGGTSGNVVNNFSYFEVYNNSTSTIDMGDYNFYIATQASKNDNDVNQIWPCPSLELESGGTLVAWVYPGTHTVDEFNDFFGTSFVENEDIVRISYGVGLIPGTVRYLEIGTAPGPLDSYVSYAMFNEGDVPEVPATSNGAIKYTYPTNGGNGSLKLTTGVPTPGEVEEGQTPSAELRVTHVPPPREEEPEISFDEADFPTVPPLYITEVYAKGGTNSKTRVNDFSFFEVYNNSQQTVDMSDWTFYIATQQYMNADTVNQTWPCPRLELESGGTLVVWADAGSNTVADFNNFFGTNFVENVDIVRIVYSVGLIPSTVRYLEIGTHPGPLDAYMSYAVFNASDSPEVPLAVDESIKYTYPRDRGNRSAMMATSAPTPGTVEEGQTPPEDKRVEYLPPVIDTEEASVTIEGHDVPGTVVEGKEYWAYVKAKNARGDIRIHYRSAGDTSWKSYAFRVSSGDPGIVWVRVPATATIGRDYIEFYISTFDVRDDVTKQSEIFRADVIRLGKAEGPWLNLNDGDFISGDVTIEAGDGIYNAVDVLINDGETASTTAGSIGGGAILSFNASGMMGYYKNAITGQYDGERDTLITIVAGNQLADQACFVDGKYFTRNPDGSHDLELTAWAGSLGTAFEDITDDGKDTMNLRYIALKLSNGETFYPLKPGGSPYAYGDTIKVDSASSNKFALRFHIPAESLPAAGYVLNTKALADGAHTVSAVSGNGRLDIGVTVDNTPPVIDFEIAPQGQRVTGTLTVDPDISDFGSGVDADRTSITLDGKPVSPHDAFPTSELVAGEHTLAAEAYDRAGNKSVEQITFQTDTRNPADVTPGENSVASDGAELSVSIGAMNAADGVVAFGVGKTLTAENGGVSIKEGLDGKIADAAGDGLTTTAPYGGMPYHIFTVRTGTVDDDDLISVNWQGSADYVTAGREIDMFALNTATHAWEYLASAPNGVIKTDFKAKNHVSGGEATLFVQCRADGGIDVPVNTASNTTGPDTGDVTPSFTWDGTNRPDYYDFAFAWETDTQYYARYTANMYNYTEQNQWLVENKETWKIPYVLHTGDIVDEYYFPYQWELADEAMRIFDDADFPYGVLAGNHDVGHGGMNYDAYWKYFGEDRFAGRDYYGGSLNNNLSHYDLISAGGQDFVILYFSWDAHKAEIDWANDVLEQYRDRKAILTFHTYATDAAELGYVGRLFQREVVAKNPNVFMTLNGHFHGAAIRVDEFDDGTGTLRKVYQICTDYQSAPQGGVQYMKFLYFDLRNDKVYINSYSPKRDDFNYFDHAKLASYESGTRAKSQDIYELDVDFDTTAKSLTTASFVAYVYRDGTFAEVAGVTDHAAATWDGLMPETEYEWYARVVNADGGVTYSAPSNFRTIAADTGTGTDTDTDTGTDGDGEPDVEDGGVAGPGGDNGNSGGGGGSALPSGNTETGEDAADKPETTSEGSPSTRPAPSFGDVQAGAWYAQAANYVVSNNLFLGVSASEFAPNLTMNRAMFVTVLARLEFGSDDRVPAGSSAFADLSQNWYKNAIAWGNSNGIINGLSAELFGPSDSVTRGQIAVLLYRYAQFKGYDTSIDEGSLTSYADADSISAYAREAMQWAVGKGIIMGVDTGALDPASESTRAQVATMVMRFAEQYRQTGQADGDAAA